MMTKNKLTEIPVLGFPTKNAWEQWLRSNNGSSAGIWMRIGKGENNQLSVKYQEALDIALCYGWIDGQKQAYDETAWLQKFTPRQPQSIWSKRNRERTELLIRQGRMRKPGLAAIETAKRNGRWMSAYESQSNAPIPVELRKALDRNPKARKFFESLDSANRYSIIFRLRTATKEETRQRRLETFMEMLRRGETLHPPKENGKKNAPEAHPPSAEKE